MSITHVENTAATPYQPKINIMLEQRPYRAPDIELPSSILYMKRNVTLTICSVRTTYSGNFSSIKSKNYEFSGSMKYIQPIPLYSIEILNTNVCFQSTVAYQQLLTKTQKTAYGMSKESKLIPEKNFYTDPSFKGFPHIYKLSRFDDFIWKACEMSTENQQTNLGKNIHHVVQYIAIVSIILCCEFLQEQVSTSESASGTFVQIKKQYFIGIIQVIRHVQSKVVKVGVFFLFCGSMGLQSLEGEAGGLSDIARRSANMNRKFA